MSEPIRYCACGCGQPIPASKKWNCKSATEACRKKLQAAYFAMDSIRRRGRNRASRMQRTSDRNYSLSDYVADGRQAAQRKPRYRSE